MEGVYAYDPSTGKTSGSPAHSFPPDQPFAAKVDWASLPSSVTVGAHWYNSLEQEVGGLSPSPAGALARRGALVVPTHARNGTENLPGQYTMVVARYSNGQAMELLARTSVLVERTG